MERFQIRLFVGQTHKIERGIILKKQVDFSKECTVFILGKGGEGEDVSVCYERPQFVSDEELTREAMMIFNDMKAKRLQNISELGAIYIARNEEQYSQMPQERIIPQKRTPHGPYVPQIPSREEVNKALESYYEVSFDVKGGAVVAKTRIGVYQCADYSGKNAQSEMPKLANRPECLACFFIDNISDLFYQTKEYIRIYSDNMSLKKLYMIESREKHK